ncbi:MAG: universal stress protein [Deltaproteobacteria bacterium]|nr:universal stress protein [Deltaproteobacteria bacterium]
MEYRCIVCPIDDSGFTLKAEETAAYLSQVTGARLVLVYVMQKWYNADVLVTDSEEWSAIHKRWLEEGQELLEREADKLRAKGVKFIKTELRDGETSYEIIQLAYEQHANLIVMATERASLAEKILGNSVSYNVTNNSPCPVLWVY